MGIDGKGKPSTKRVCSGCGEEIGGTHGTCKCQKKSSSKKRSNCIDCGTPISSSATKCNPCKKKKK